MLAVYSLDLFSEGFGVYENIYTIMVMVHTTCLVECSPHVNIFLRRTRFFSKRHLDKGGGHRSE